MHGELVVLERTCIWKIVDIPRHIKPIDCRRIFKIKFHVYDSIEKFKHILLQKATIKLKVMTIFTHIHSSMIKTTTVI